MMMIVPLTGYCDLTRAFIGLELFPSFLASDRDIKNKVGSNHQLNVMLLYQYRESDAQNLANRLKKINTIRNIPIGVFIIHYDKLTSWQNDKLAGLFITEENIPLQSIIQYGIKHQIIVFSPFQGDVEQGATGGIFVMEKYCTLRQYQNP